MTEIVKLLREILYWLQRPYQDEMRRLGCRAGINDGTGQESYHDWNVKNYGSCHCQTKLIVWKPKGEAEAMEPIKLKGGFNERKQKSNYQDHRKQ